MNQSVRILSPDVAKLVLRLKAVTLPSDTLLAGMSSESFRRLFKKTCSLLGLSDRYVPHSLRHGGATRLWIMGKEISTIKTRGRWKSLDSCERYLQVAESVIGVHRAPSATVKLANMIATNVLKSISDASFQYAASHSKTAAGSATAAAGTGS